jgi:DNA-binding SARP family transcriptional activator
VRRARLVEPLVSANHPNRREGRPVIRLFGALEIEDDARTLGARDLGGARPKQVLEILLAARGHRVSTDRLADLLWGDQQPHDPPGSVQTFVSVLRRRLARDRDRARELVITETEAYRFATDLVALDLDCFDQLLERSAHEPTHTARRSLERALALVRGDVLEDEPYALWAQELRGTYRGRVLGAHLEAADAALAELDYGAALAHAEAAAALDCFSERAQRTAMLALYALGRQHDALATYREFRARLDRELGLELTSETRMLETAILRQQEIQSLLPRAIRPTQRDTAPQSIRLLGRTSELATLERTVQRALAGSFALVLVEGEAGLGKTRLLDEFVTSLVGARIGRASCSELEQHLPYVPLAAALRSALADVELDAERLPALAQILPELALREPQQYAEVDALEALVALLVEHAPVVLAIDDLESADLSTLAALGYLQRRCTDVPAMVLGAVRVGATFANEPLRLLQPDARVRLEPLSSTDLAPLGIPDLHESTGGNPRFVAETVRNGNRPALSRTLSDALLGQCRAAGAYAHRVLLAASLLEQPFEPETLAALLHVDATELAEELERLCEHRILRVDGFHFRFRYDLVRQVLLTSISPARRRLLQAGLDRASTTDAPIPLPQVARAVR